MVQGGLNTKSCTECGVIKPLSDFRRKRTGKLGRQSACKACSNAKLDVWRAKTRERRYAYNREYWKTPRGREKMRAYMARNRTKYAAQSEAQQAVKRGELIRPTCCEECGREREVHGHHDDYAKPLVVRWLCRPCHKAWHVKHGEGLNPNVQIVRNGLWTARVAAKAARLPKVIELAAAGKSQTEIAGLFGVTPSTICHDLKTAAQYAAV